MEDLSVYIHIPFCLQKCHYCGFLSFSSTGNQQKRYVDALISEIKQRSRDCTACRIATLYFGGGCPTLLTRNQWHHIHESLQKRFHFSPKLEWTVEVNPSTVSSSDLVFLKKMGVNRLSFGIQSFSPSVRFFAGRKGNILQAIELIQYAQSVGYSNIGIDLMMGLPGQSYAVFQKDIERGLKLQPQHISIYFLTLEKGTHFYWNRKRISFPPEDETIRCYTYACKQLNNAGYEHYEVSNWGEKRCECQHNRVYWQRGEYLGLGLGAHSFVKGKRFFNTRNPAIYEKGYYRDMTSLHTVSKDETFLEYLLLSLRTKGGLSFSYIHKTFGEKKERSLRKKIMMSPYRSSLRISQNGTYVTEQGYLLLDAIVSDLL